MTSAREPRRFKVMCDYSAFPVWEISETDWQLMVAPDSFPISERLRADLWAWAGECEAPSGTWAEWHARGRRLARDLKRELGPSTDVVYCDERGNLEPVEAS